jgi:CheY-like chemotaxis protein
MCHVLIIEDEPLVAMEIEDILMVNGATSVEIVDTEQAAVAAAISHPPKVITSDVKLFTGTGPSAVREIQKRLGPVPVIFITGTPGECIPCDPPGSIVTKPFSRRIVADAFQAALS